MKVGDILCKSLCIIVSQVTSLYTWGWGVGYKLTSPRKKVGSKKSKEKDCITLAYMFRLEHCIAWSNAWLIFLAF